MTTGLTLSVYRDANGSDCSLDGVSARNHRLALVGTLDHRHPNHPSKAAVKPLPANLQLPTAYVDSMAPVALCLRNMGDELLLGIVPVDIAEDGTITAKLGTMFGGNYAATSDSRFREIVSSVTGKPRDGFYGAIAIHDRIES